MTLQVINNGSRANDETAETLFSAFEKVKSNFSELYGIYGSEVEAFTFTTKQNDLALAAGTRILRWNGAGTTGITGIAAPSTARVVAIVNASTDYLLWLENENTASAAANRLMLPDGFPAFLMPGDTITLLYDLTAGRWRVVSWPTRGKAMGLTGYTDHESSNVGVYNNRTSGTGASSGSGSTDGVNSTSRALGVTRTATGTTSSGYSIRAYDSSTNAMVAPTLGCALAVARIRVPSTPTAAEDFGVLLGFHNGGATGTFSNGVCWEHWWNGSAAEMSRTVAAGGVIARSPAAGLSASTSWMWLAVFVNPAWTRADYIYSTDGIAFTLDGSISSGLPSVTQLVGPQFGIMKRAGTTDKLVYHDLNGHRIDQVRA